MTDTDIEEAKEIVAEAIESGDFQGAIELAENIAELEAAQDGE